MKKHLLALSIGGALATASMSSMAAANNVGGGDAEALKAQLKQLEQELAATEAKLAEAEADSGGEEAEPEGITLFDDTLKVGGAIRANYAISDSPETGGASQAPEDGGNFSLDTFRINLDYANGPWLGKVEYRWYDGYNFLHTGWVGYNFEDAGQLQAGVNRVPFGPGPYGVSQSWFFDQHYYLGLSDDMDLGVKYSTEMGDWNWDVAYYIGSEGTYTGNTKDSSRYSYDVVNESGDGYEERNQFNVRGVYSVPGDVAIATDVGFSAQYGELESKGVQDDGDHYAGSVHMINKWDNFTLASQLTYFRFDVDSAQPLGTADKVQMGAYDFPNTVASEGWVPAVSLSYNQSTPGIEWLDYVIPYVEYSSIMKEASGFNDSELLTVGAAWGSGGWYIYTDLAFSNGNEFVGGDTAFGDRLGANPDDDWLTRFNINFGYYF
ncbi:hypothetical protein [Guyparkeria sp.]|uniref:hypothetical protein n=1 Tax=Guyparkeria sp. TaxID=2035736 RepID=UPI00397113E7